MGRRDRWGLGRDKKEREKGEGGVGYSRGRGTRGTSRKEFRLGGRGGVGRKANSSGDRDHEGMDEKQKEEEQTRTLGIQTGEAEKSEME